MEFLVDDHFYSNSSPSMFNVSRTDLLSPPNLLRPPNLSLALPGPMLTLLLALYIPVILLAVLGSLLVMLSVIRSPSLRTCSNSYLVNLALSDLLLAALACPITLVQLTFKSWQLPLHPALCSLSSFLPLFFSFASTFTITVIALDRHQLIVHSSQPHYRARITGLTLAGVWVGALLCSAPILPNTRLDIHTLPPAVSEVLGISERAYCREDWGYPKGRLLYSIVILSIQLLLPSAILIMAHARDDQGPAEVKFRSAFSVCHLLGMSSAISNPLIYGYFNQGFREEFWKIILPCRKTPQFSPATLYATTKF
ncbi:neuropeptide F receptor [Eurytemora carolleeae]|uniref:neuropeptide F receptor n=1 Tax=Eurytemora carolleeae TaxID=1294199 RepID=UPI000C76E24A|nr:neuropeptide F receptor [Eurytemora carolleeae]|eukprot:XP_023328563.1 neuropeptide F receptor-like [Eurytemora affinis]